MEIKMIVTDLDNTLLRRDKTISNYTERVFDHLQERGVLVAFATSRSAQASARFRQIIRPDVNITSGGAIATMGGQQLFRAAIDIGTASAIIHELKKSEGIFQITADTEEHYFDSKPIDKSWLGWVDYSNSITTDFTEQLPVPDVFKITPKAANKDAVSEIVSKFESVDVLNFTGEDWYQIKSRKASKMLAIMAVCKQLHIQPAQVVAFGDDYNDIEMLSECGIGIAVDNAIDECKAVSNYVCNDCDADGVARWLKEHLL